MGLFILENGDAIGNVCNNEFYRVMNSGNNEVVLLLSGVFRPNNTSMVNYKSLPARFVNLREVVGHIFGEQCWICDVLIERCGSREV